MSENLKMFHIGIEIAGLFLCCQSFLVMYVAARTDIKMQFKALFVFVCLFFDILANMLGVLLKGLPGFGIHILLMATNFLEFFFYIGLMFSITYFLFARVDLTETKLWYAICTLCCLGFLGLIISQFTGLYYTIDENNYYHRSKGQIINTLLYLTVTTTDIYVLIKSWKKLGPKEKITFVTCIFLPLFATIIQTLFYGIYPVTYASIIGGLSLFYYLISNSMERYYKTEQKCQEMKENIMLSQIQPHFLYNSLSTIQELCASDPKLAEQAIISFSRYLRHNMDSLTENTLSNLDDELTHVKNYLSIEKLRFGDALEIKYDILYLDISMPTLTMQPLVENAVRHGIRRNKNGIGRIIIDSIIQGEYYVINITDDGPGFDLEKEKKDGRTHIGIKNVSERLERICNGKLKIRSKPGEGTCVSIFLPLKHT